MNFNRDIAYSEQTFFNDEEARDRAMRQTEERDMQDWQQQDLDRELLIQARKEAAELAQWPITCDGSGILEEFYIDVDQTEVVKCHGCPACDLELAEFGAPQRKGIESEIDRATRRAPLRRIA